MGELDRIARDLSHVREMDLGHCHRHVGAGAGLFAAREVIDANRPVGWPVAACRRAHSIPPAPPLAWAITQQWNAYDPVILGMLETRHISIWKPVEPEAR